MAAKFDVTKHVEVPKHEVMEKEEVEALLQRYNITRGQLPKITASDPVLKKINANLGDVVKITRKSRTAGQSVYHRVVVSE